MPAAATRRARRPSESPASVTDSPDTSYAIRRSPILENFLTPRSVLGKVEGGDYRMDEGPVQPRQSASATHLAVRDRDRGRCNRDRGSAFGPGRRPHCSNGKAHLATVRRIKVRRAVGPDRDGCSPRGRSDISAHGPAGFARLAEVDAELAGHWFGCDCLAYWTPDVGQRPEQVAFEPALCVDQSRCTKSLHRSVCT